MYDLTAEQYEALEEGVWAEGAPVYSAARDKYFFDTDEIADCLAEWNWEEAGVHGNRDHTFEVKDFQFLQTYPAYCEEIDLDNYMVDARMDGYGDGVDLPPAVLAALERANEVIRDCNTPLSWYPSNRHDKIKKITVSLESVLSVQSSDCEDELAGEVDEEKK